MIKLRLIRVAYLVLVGASLGIFSTARLQAADDCGPHTKWWSDSCGGDDVCCQGEGGNPVTCSNSVCCDIDGQHGSGGHCCPNGLEWSQDANTCLPSCGPAGGNHCSQPGDNACDPYPAIASYDCSASGQRCCNIPPAPTAHYRCSGAGTCIQDDDNGTFTSSDCDNTCVPPATPHYRCSGANTCIRDDVNGTFTSSDCDNTCVPPATPHYRCSGANTCIQDDVNGTFTSSDCDNTCVPPATPHYRCSGANTCIQDDVNGTFTSSDCDNTCAPPATPHYRCSGAHTCIRDDVFGDFTSSDCDNTCVPPATPHYRCSGANTCIQDDVNGTFTSSDCDNTCAPPATPHYRCSGAHTCIRDDVFGDFTSSDCDNTCAPPATPHYRCSGANTCIQDDVNGTFTSSDCDNTCAPPATPHYRCSGAHTCIRDDVYGDFTVSDCDNTCAPGTTAHYRCSGAGSCIRDDANGTFTRGDCDNTCSTGAMPHYRCSGAGTCVQDDASGTFTAPDCNNTCTVTPLYRCTGAGDCIQDDTHGTFTASNCNNTCAPETCNKFWSDSCRSTDVCCTGAGNPTQCSNGVCCDIVGQHGSSGKCCENGTDWSVADGACVAAPTTHYRCNGSGACIQDDAAGTFTASDCNNTCSQPEVCNKPWSDHCGPSDVCCTGAGNPTQCSNGVCCDIVGQHGSGGKCCGNGTDWCAVLNTCATAADCSAGQPEVCNKSWSDPCGSGDVCCKGAGNPTQCSNGVCCDITGQHGSRGKCCPDGTEWCPAVGSCISPLNCTSNISIRRDSQAPSCGQAGGNKCVGDGDTSCDSYPQFASNDCDICCLKPESDVASFTYTRTYRVSCQGGTGTPSTTVAVVVSGASHELSLPAEAPIDGSLVVGTPPGFTAAWYEWEITPAGDFAGSPRASTLGMPAYRNAGRSVASAHLTTPTNSLTLSGLGLIAGNYSVSVQAFNSRGVASPKVSKNIALVSDDFPDVRVFPNPWRVDQPHDPYVTFDNLPWGATIKIFTVSGHWVQTLTPSGTSIQWPLTNSSGDAVASGIYLYLITHHDQKKSGQLFIIK